MLAFHSYISMITYEQKADEHTWLFAVMLLITAVLSRLAIC